MIFTGCQNTRNLSAYIDQEAEWNVNLDFGAIWFGQVLFLEKEKTKKKIDRDKCNLRLVITDSLDMNYSKNIRAPFERTVATKSNITRTNLNWLANNNIAHIVASMWAIVAYNYPRYSMIKKKSPIFENRNALLQSTIYTYNISCTH